MRKLATLFAIIGMYLVSSLTLALAATGNSNSTSFRSPEPGSLQVAQHYHDCAAYGAARHCTARYSHQLLRCICLR